MCVGNKRSKGITTQV